MTGQTLAPLAHAAALAPPPPPSLPPEIVFSLTDRRAEFIFDGSAPWSPDYGARRLATHGITKDRASRTLAEIDDALAPVPMSWLTDRLTIVWGMFMATRSAIGDEDAVTAWLGEYLRLLCDLPHDLAAAAIDKAIQTARHGFIPSIGEIRAHADPQLTERRRYRERLAQSIEAIEAAAAGVPAQ